MRLRKTAVLSFLSLAFLVPGTLQAVDKNFHDAPDSAKAEKNPYEGQQEAIDAGKTVYARNCLACHGKAGQGTGNVPSLVGGKLKGVAPGEVFWFVTKGSKENGMPSWAFLPEQKRWQVVSYVEAMAEGKAPTSASAAPPADTASASPIKAAVPHTPFTDFRYEKPGTVRKISVNDLPQPYETKSSDNGADLVARPESALPIAPAGFKVEQFAAGLDNPRLLRTAPNGDIFLAESNAGRIRIFRGMTEDGKPEQTAIFASGLKRPYGIAFYPPGSDPQWVYIGNTNEVVRFAYHKGDLKAGRSEERRVGK